MVQREYDKSTYSHSGADPRLKHDDTRDVRTNILMLPLEKICETQGGTPDGVRSTLVDDGPEIYRWYVVGNARVCHTVDVDQGTRTTEVLVEKGKLAGLLLQSLRAFYYRYQRNSVSHSSVEIDLESGQ